MAKKANDKHDNQEWSDPADGTRFQTKTALVGASEGADHTLAPRPNAAEPQPQNQSATNPRLDRLVLTQLASSVPGDLTDFNSIDGAVALFLDLEPADAIKSILARLLVVTANSTMDGLGRASRAGLNPTVRQMELKLAHTGTATVIDVVKALQSHRGSSDQNINVGNLNVGSGGQAIVGLQTARKNQDEDEK